MKRKRESEPSNANTPGTDPWLDRIIGGYRVMSKLGEGGMGTAYIAEHIRLPGVRAVLKTLLAEHMARADLQARFKREATTNAKLKHDRIVRIIDHDDLECGSYLLLEFVEGQTLDVHLRLRGGILPQHDVLAIVVQVADGLLHAHERGIVHRDLKPSNIIVEPNGKIKILDFGIAKDSSDEDLMTRSGAMMGTPQFMAPEQRNNAEHATPRSDLFSLGTVSWELHNGILPWGIQDSGVLYHLQRTEVPEPPRGSAMTLEWLKIHRTALRPDPATRQAGVDEFAIDLARTTKQTAARMGGRQILKKYAERFCENSDPLAMTARNAADLERLMQGGRDDGISAPPPLSAPLHGYVVGAAAPAQPVTSWERPRAQSDAEHVNAGAPGAEYVNAQPTTLSSGMSTQGSAARRARLGLVAFLSIAVALGAVIAYAIVNSVSGSSEKRNDQQIADVKSSPINNAKVPTMPADATVTGPVPTETPHAPVDAVAAAPIDAAPAIGSGATNPRASMTEAGSAEAPPQPKATDAAATPEKKARVALPVPQGEGGLEIVIEPWATVWIDGKKIGDTPVIMRIRAGRHAVRLENKDLGKVERLVVDIVPGDKPRRIKRTWRDNDEK